MPASATARGSLQVQLHTQPGLSPALPVHGRAPRACWSPDGSVDAAATRARRRAGATTGCSQGHHPMRDVPDELTGHCCCASAHDGSDNAVLAPFDDLRSTSATRCEVAIRYRPPRPRSPRRRSLRRRGDSQARRCYGGAPERGRVPSLRVDAARSHPSSERSPPAAYARHVRAPGCSPANSSPSPQQAALALVVSGRYTGLLSSLGDSCLVPDVAPPPVDGPRLYFVVIDDEERVVEVDGRVNVAGDQRDAIADGEIDAMQPDLRVLVRQIEALDLRRRRLGQSVLGAQRLESAVEHSPVVSPADHGGKAVEGRLEHEVKSEVAHVHQRVGAGLDLVVYAGLDRELERAGAAARDESAGEARRGEAVALVLEDVGGGVDEPPALGAVRHEDSVSFVALQTGEGEARRVRDRDGEREQVGASRRQSPAVETDVDLDQDVEVDAFLRG